MTALYICTIHIVATKIPRPSERKKTVKEFTEHLIPLRLIDGLEIPAEEMKSYMEKYTGLVFENYTFEYKILNAKFSSKIMQGVK
jgi:hypothetical protein